MTIGSPRWGGVRKAPYNPTPVDADNDGIVQEGTFFERPAGTRIVSALTGLELELGSSGNSLQEIGSVRIVDRDGRPVPYRQSWSSGTLSAGEQNGTIGGRSGTLGSSIGDLDGPPPAPKPDSVRLRPSDVDRNGKPLRVFVSDDRRFHGAMPEDWAGFENPAWREASAHWGGSLSEGEMPISAEDPRIPDTLFYVTRNPSAQRDLGVIRTDGNRVNLFYSRDDANIALAAERDADPAAGILPVNSDNVRTGAALTISEGQVSVFGDVRLDADAKPDPVRRALDIPTPESLDPIKDRFDAEGFELYLVGGAVRDTLMGRDIKDYDLASNANPDEVTAMLSDVEGARLDLTGKDFAVVRVNMPDGQEYEIATFRRDVGAGRRPDDVEFTTIDEDVRRRDLTMNALFYDLSTNEVVDYVGGMNDIENGVVRAVGDPGERFREDPLRILRAFRFSGRTGWGMDAATVDAIRSNSKLRGVSGERVRDEFVRGIDSAVSPSGYLQQIDLVDDGTGAVWGQVFPGLNVSPTRLPSDGSYGNRSTLIASLLANNDIEKVKAVMKDRKFTNDEIADVSLIMQAKNINDTNAASLKNQFGKNRRVSPDDMRAFHRVQPNTEDEIEPFLEFAEAPAALTAAELQARGVKPGPQFGAMLREAEEQSYREIRDNFSVKKSGKVDTKSSNPQQHKSVPDLNINIDTVSFKDADEKIDTLSQTYPELASDPDELQARLAPVKGQEHYGFAWVNKSTLQKHKEEAGFLINELEKLDVLNKNEEAQDLITQLETHQDQLNNDIKAEGAYLALEIVFFDNEGKIKTPTKIKSALNSEELKKTIDDILSQLAPEFRSARIAISPVDSSGSTIPADYGFYYPEEDRIYISPTYFQKVFRDLGVSFEEYQSWANYNNVWQAPREGWSPDEIYESMTFDQMQDYVKRYSLEEEISEKYSSGYTPSNDEDLETASKALAKAISNDAAASSHKETWILSGVDKTERDDYLDGELRWLVLHENFHGVHFRKDGSFEDPRYLKTQRKVIGSIKKSNLLNELFDDENEFYDEDNYFRYLMSWLAQGGNPGKAENKALLKDLKWDKASKDSLNKYVGAELFAEALTHAAMGRKFPGSDILLNYITGEGD